MVRRLLRLFLIPLLLAGLGFGAQNLGLWALDLLAGYSGPPVGPLSPGRATAPVSQRVVVVVVDGLREDTSHQMPTFQRLRERGADLPSWTGMPSLSYPGYATLGTGAYPDFTGVASNWYQGPVKTDSLFARARGAGRPTALSAMSGWDMLYRPWVSSVYTATWSDSGHEPSAITMTTEAIGQEARRVLQETDAALLYVHFGETDEAGHAYGGTSPQYLEAARHVDAQIAAIADVLDWGRDTLILTADHGMTADIRGRGGGHGGSEPECRRVPLVMVGRGIRPGAYADGGQADLVPTVAALLGLPIPTHNQGRARLEALVLTPEEKADKALALGEQQEALYAGYLNGLGAPQALDGLEMARAAFSRQEYARVPGLVGEFLGRLDAAVARAAANRLWKERLIRLPFLLVPLLIGAGFVGLYRPRRDLLGPLLLALFFGALYVAFFWGIRGFTFSFSTMGGQEVADFFLSRIADAFIVMGVVAVVAGVTWRRRPWHEVAWQANLSAAVVAWAWLVQIGLYLWLEGLHLTWRLPDLSWGFKYYLDLLTMVGVGYAAPAGPLLAVGVSLLFPLARWLWRHLRALATRRGARS